MAINKIKPPSRRMEKGPTNFIIVSILLSVLRSFSMAISSIIFSRFPNFCASDSWLYSLPVTNPTGAKQSHKSTPFLISRIEDSHACLKYIFCILSNANSKQRSRGMFTFWDNDKVLKNVLLEKFRPKEPTIGSLKVK